MFIVFSETLILQSCYLCTLFYANHSVKLLKDNPCFQTNMKYNRT